MFPFFRRLFRGSLGLQGQQRALFQPGPTSPRVAFSSLSPFPTPSPPCPRWPPRALGASRAPFYAAALAQHFESRQAALAATSCWSFFCMASQQGFGDLEPDCFDCEETQRSDGDGSEEHDSSDGVDASAAAGDVVIQTTSESDMESLGDLAAGSLPPPAKRTRTTSKPGPRALPDGPKSVDDALRWPELFKRATSDTELGHAAPLWQRFAHIVSQVGVETTSDFSGSGQFETACGMLERAMKEDVDFKETANKGFVTRRSGDLSKWCRTVLMHNKHTKQGCINGDMTCRMKDYFKLSVRDVMEKYKTLRAEDSSKQAADKMNESLKADLLKSLRSAKDKYDEFGSPAVRAWCATCDSNSCRVCGGQQPGEAAQGPNATCRLRMHCAGVPCTHVSQRGSQDGLAGDTTPALMQWLFERLIEEEDLIIGECTRMFKPDIVFEALGEDKYHCMHHVFSPSSLGIPAGRYRIYFVALKRSSVRWTSARDLECLLKEMLYRKCVFPGSDFLRAPQQIVDQHLAGIARSKGLDSSGLQYKHVVSAGLRKRMKMFVKLAKEKHGYPPIPDRCCDLMQYPQRSQLSKSLPALTQRSRLLNCVSK